MTVPVNPTEALQWELPDGFGGLPGGDVGFLNAIIRSLYHIHETPGRGPTYVFMQSAGVPIPALVSPTDRNDVAWSLANMVSPDGTQGAAPSSVWSAATPAAFTLPAGIYAYAVRGEWEDPNIHLEDQAWTVMELLAGGSLSVWGNNPFQWVEPIIFGGAALGNEALHGQSGLWVHAGGVGRLAVAQNSSLATLLFKATLVLTLLQEL